MNSQSLQPQPTPQLRHLSSAYEDPFSDVVSAIEPANQEQNDTETPSIDRDNKLLSFSIPTFDYTLLDWTNTRTSISLSAQLHGMFFLAESPWANAGEAQPPSSELTCYRRNLFQVTGEITLPRALRSMLTDQGEHIPIVGQELVICATESTERNPVKIISVPWKTHAHPNAPVPEEKTEQEPPAIPLDLVNVQEMDSNLATFPFQWKRLQFRIATANNGRRRELQQHFTVRLRVLATLSTGVKIPICEVQSGAIIVRGRSPRNFQARKDMPLNGAGHARKISQLPGHVSRASSGESTKKVQDGPTSAPLKTEMQAPPMQSYFDFNGPPSNDFYDWKGTVNTQPGATTTIPPHASPLEHLPGYPASSPDLPRFTKPHPVPSAPINLSLVEDIPTKPSTSSSRTPSDHHRPAKKLHIPPPHPPSFSINTVNSPDESADLLYEYFPLGLDDWMPPVEAVYRPHVVHHTKLPSDPRDPKTSVKGGSRSKRYFSEDVS